MVEGKTLLVLLLLGRCQHPARVPQPAILQCARSAVHPCSNTGTAKQGWLACGAPGIHGGVLAFDGFAQLGLVLHCGAVSSRRGFCLTTRGPHHGYEPQQRSAPGNMHLQNNMTPCFQDGGHVQGQARTMKVFAFAHSCKSVKFLSPDLWASTFIQHAMRARPGS